MPLRKLISNPKNWGNGITPINHHVDAIRLPLIA